MCFTPGQDCTAEIVNALDNARQSILVQAYSFTSAPIAHNKVMIIDHIIVITGSFNYTKAAALRNAENLLIIHDPILAQQYLDNWNSASLSRLR